MQIPADRWLEAIHKRHSRRQYNSQNLPPETLAHLQSFTQQLNEQLRGARVAFVNENPDEVFKGLVGSYGKVKGSPAYAAFIGDTTDPNFQEKMGYLGEAFILEATALDLGTCWVGGAFRLETIQQHTKVEAQETVLAVTPVGFKSEQYSFMEKTMTRMARSKARKSLDELIESEKEKERPQWMNVALEAARISPSAINRQPWRFIVEDNGIKVKVDQEKNSIKISKRLDCGIAMLHLEVGALASGVKGQWEYLESPDVARFGLV